MKSCKRQKSVLVDLAPKRIRYRVTGPKSLIFVYIFKVKTVRVILLPTLLGQLGKMGKFELRPVLYVEFWSRRMQLRQQIMR